LTEHGARALAFAHPRLAIVCSPRAATGGHVDVDRFRVGDDIEGMRL
jgi:hypothetical protein